MKTLLISLLCVSVAYAASLREDGNRDFQSLLNPGRIVGGSLTEIQRYPYITSLQSILGSHFCGGSLVTRNHILTAAHCERSTFNVRARAGSADNRSGGQLRQASAWRSHDYYDRATLSYDVAIVTVSSPFDLGSSVALVALAEVEAQSGSSIHVAGWSVVRESAISGERHLRHVAMPVMHRSDCENVYPWMSYDQVCFGGKAEQSACFGDSGGPAVIGNVQYGIVSGGWSCHLVDNPGLYGNVAALKGWIRQHV